ncbi:type VII secretion system-associated protein [Streptomyces sp. SID7982]|nr:type VII secretion system-associated protein [Streptomyces sp. SID7982]
MADLSELDKASLQAFIEQDLSEFKGDIKKVLEGAPSLKAMSEGRTTADTVLTVGKNEPLVMARIGDSDDVNGESFVKSLASNIETAVTTLEGQLSTFEEIEDGLRQTIEKLFKTQGDNLAAIEAGDFSEILSEAGFSGDASSPDSGGDDASGGKSDDKDKSEDSGEGGDKAT